MRRNVLDEVLRSGRPAVSGWLSVGDPYLAEVLSHAGYDAVVVDLQHGMFGLDRAPSLLQAVGSGPAVPFARCPSHDPSTIGKLLDAGAYGIICPAVDTPGQAAALVAACRYPPAGARSFGPSRGLLYGGADYVAHADRTVMAWAMVESAAAVEAVDAIAATPGLDGVYVGPNDLALSYGEPPGQLADSPRTREGLRRVAAAARTAGRWAGVFCADVAIARDMLDLGYHLVTPGNDIGVLRQAVVERIGTVRGTDAITGSGGGGY